MADPSGQGCNSNYCPVGTTSFESSGKSGRLCGAVLTPAAAAATLNIYQGQSATGNPILTLGVPASAASVGYYFSQAQPTYAGGFTAVVTGAGATCQVFTKPLT